MLGQRLAPGLLPMMNSTEDSRIYPCGIALAKLDLSRPTYWSVVEIRGLVLQLCAVNNMCHIAWSIHVADEPLHGSYTIVTEIKTENDVAYHVGSK